MLKSQIFGTKLSAEIFDATTFRNFGFGRILVETLGFGRFRSYTITETPSVKVDDLAPTSQV